MDIDTDLPPSPRTKLTGRGWLVLAANLLLGACLTLVPWPHPFVVYMLFVIFGLIVGLPGGMHYQGDIDSYLGAHPGVKRTELPWPADYQALSRAQAVRYVSRGVFGACTYGLMMPLMPVWAALADGGIVSGQGFDTLFRAMDTDD